jgi:polyphenol oxidase
MAFNGFIRREVDGVVFHACPALERLPGVCHGFSTRFGGTGSLNLTHLAWDSRERVEENRRRLLAALGLSSARLVTLSQIHSDRLQVFHEGPEDWNRRREGDALATRQACLALAVQVADCFPILLADPQTRSISAVHSGWRGTASRILCKTIEEMRRVFDVSPASLVVAIGPGIRSCCMQVGPEVAARYEEEYPGLGLALARAGHPDKFLLDLPRALAIQCAEAGLNPKHIFDMEACTHCRADEFFSYRAEGAAAGRMMAVIGRRQ